jgi:hypothetical protein
MPAKTGTDLVVVELGPTSGCFVCPTADCPLLGTGMAWEVDLRVYFDDVKWQDGEGYRVWCIPLPSTMSRAQVLEAVRHRGEKKGAVRIEVFNVDRPWRAA